MTVSVNEYSNNATSQLVTSQAPVALKDDVDPWLRAAEQFVDGRCGGGVADGACERGVPADEGIGLKLGQVRGNNIGVDHESCHDAPS